uniref:UPF0407 protein C2orf39-like protein n=1 Tax=Magallana gigas TaxID=29159 RepID=K1QIQ9_MAGGI
MSSSGEEDETGPSVDSMDPEERIQARRERINRRIDAAKRAELGEDPNDKKEVKEELSKSRKQVEQSRLRLTKLKQDGNELVTNIRVAGDSREAARRAEDDDAKRQRKDRLEQEAKSGAEKFEEITKKWEQALQKEIPQSLYQMLRQQKDACKAIVLDKNKLIKDFQEELQKKDDLYIKDLKKQADDIDLMIERMEEQIKSLSTSYKTEIEEIEGNSCICLPNGFDDFKNRLPPSKCTYMCDKALLMSSECGGESAFNIFSTASSHFNGSSPTTDNNLKWRDGMNRCKSNGVYLIGKINLTNIVSACQTFTHNQRWIGVVKESYTSYDQGNDITEIKQMISYCQQCRMMKNGIDHECEYVQCTKKLKSDVYCSEQHGSPSRADPTTKQQVQST